MKLKDFAELVQGKVIGNPETEITGVSGIRDAAGGDITFLASPKYQHYLKGCQASCLIVREPMEGIPLVQLVVPNPTYAFARAIEQFFPGPSHSTGISDSSIIAETATIGRNAAVLPFAFISDAAVIGEETVIGQGAFVGENTKIGRQCMIFPNVTIRENVTIGDRVRIHSGTVIGSDGFGYIFEKGEHYKIPQVGGVIIGDDVEIGSNVSIDRATLGNTVIGSGTKIDNLAQIAHNVKIGERSLIVAQVAIGGSTEIGSYVTLAGQVGVADHTSIESGTIVGAQSGLAGKITKGAYSGSPAIDHKNWLRSQSLFAKLPEMNRRLRELEERLMALEKERAQ